MDIKRIHCERRYAVIGSSLIDGCGFDRIPDYFRDWTTDGGSVMLCDHEASKWWDTEDAEEIYITLSNEPHPGAYRVTLIHTIRMQCDTTHMRLMEIEAENGEGVYEYVIYPKLYHELKQFNPTCYMGIEIL